MLPQNHIGKVFRQCVICGDYQDRTSERIFSRSNHRQTAYLLCVFSCVSSDGRSQKLHNHISEMTKLSKPQA